MTPGGTGIRLLRPTLEMLPGYVDALQRGWSPDNIRGEIAAREHLDRIAHDAAAFVALQEDREARGGPIRMLNGTEKPRLPGFMYWIWDGGFCGTVGFRWQPGTEALPEHVLGHAGYAVVPWKRGQGCATAGLAQLLPLARAEGLAWIELTTDPANIASQKVILANGGRLLGSFLKAEVYGGHEGLRFRIDLE